MLLSYKFHELSVLCNELVSIPPSYFNRLDHLVRKTDIEHHQALKEGCGLFMGIESATCPPTNHSCMYYVGLSKQTKSIKLTNKPV